MIDIINYYHERDKNTAILAEEALELQIEIDEEESTQDTSKVTWSNLRNDEDRCKIICGFSPEEFSTLYMILLRKI
jgi:hypothetical protein